MTKKRVLRLQTYVVVGNAIDSGIKHGLHRWLKYREKSIDDEDLARATEHISREVDNALCEVVDWERTEE